LHNRSIELTLAEFISITAVITVALLILTAYLTDTIGLPIDPTAMLIALLIEGIIIAIGLRRTQQWPRLRIERGEIIGYVLVLVGFFSYILLIARHASFLPISESPDLIHHLSLIDFIQQRHSLPHDPSLEKYLGEMVSYSPGSHLLAALSAAWFNTNSLHLLQPLLALWVALKAAFIYQIILHVLPPSRRNPIFAVTGTLFLLFAWGYFLLSFIGQFYYPQVITETFVIALLWATVVWTDQRAAPSLIVCCTLIGMAIWLSWPLWLPISLTSPIGLILIQRHQSWRSKLKSIGLMISLIGLIVIVSSINRINSANILNGGGVVIRPSLELFGRPLLILTTLGFILNIRKRRVWPVLFLIGATLFQSAALLVFEASQSVTDYYYAFKMFHLVIYPMAILAALALDWFWQQVESRLRKLPQRGWPKFSVALPLIVLVIATRRDLPWNPVTAVSEPVYQVGLWAKQNLPSSCVDYLVDHWATAYWLHINVLGNPRRTERSHAIVAGAGQQAWPPVWSDADHLPYVIANDWNELSSEDRTNLIVLYQNGSAVAARRAGSITCTYNDVPIDQYR
jgi:hypothetical protein